VAVLDNPGMPIVGENGEEENDRFVEQLVANAEAAVHELKRRGVSGLRLSESLSLSVNTEIILHSGLRNDCSQQVADFA
jgi:hypothetical protein